MAEDRGGADDRGGGEERRKSERRQDAERRKFERLQDDGVQPDRRRGDRRR